MEKEVFINLVDSYKGKLSITWLCHYFGIARSTYYRWSKKEYVADNRIKMIEQLCKENKFTYGYRKITFLLRKKIKVNHKVVQRIMQKYGWSCQVKIKKEKRPGSIYFKTTNVIDRDFSSSKPLEKLTTDITLSLFQWTAYQDLKMVLKLFSQALWFNVV